MSVRRALFNIAWPDYECADCIGMKELGCYCMSAGAPRPGGPGPEWWRVGLRHALYKVGWGYKP